MQTCAITLPAEITAAATLVAFWDTDASFIDVSFCYKVMFSWSGARIS